MSEPLLGMNQCDLWFSEDDYAKTGKGYYWQEWHGNQRCSDCYETRRDAIQAMEKGNVKFREWGTT